METSKNITDEWRMYSYEEYKVYELFRNKYKESEIHSQFLPEGVKYPVDLFLPNGMPSLNLDGATIIEIKRYLSYATVKEMNALYLEYGDKYNILIIFFNKSVTHIPDEDETRGKVLKFVSFAELSGNKTRSRRPKNFYDEKTRKQNWEEKRKDIIKNAQDAIGQGNNVLFLGAGVSISANMPSWKELLRGLMGEVRQLNESTLDAFKELSSHVLDECGNSSPIMARYLQTAVKLHDDKVVFSELIQKYLYNDKNTSELLDSLAHIIQQKKVNEVITYNFDDVLEQNLAKLNLKDSIDYTSISKDAEIKGHNTLPIYHVHGIIPKTGPVDTVVFSEEEYHNRYSNAFHWSNIEQLHALSRMHCFFIGLSMTDPNLRRLLDVAYNMNRTNGDNHYAFLRRTQMDKYCVSDIDRSCKYVHVSECLIDKKKQKEIYDLNYMVIEQIYLELGVRVIWYEDFNELPKLVAEVFGLTRYQSVDTEHLVELCTQKIKEIKEIEDGQSKFYTMDRSNIDVEQFFEYKNEYSEIYKNRIAEVNDVLQELSERVDFKKIVEEGDIKKIHKLQKQVPKFNDNLNGFGDYYEIWLETVKKLL